MANPVRIFLAGAFPGALDELAGLIACETGFSVCGKASDALGALAALDSAAPDVVVIDAAVEPRDSVELVEALCARLPRVAVLVLAAQEDLLFAERALRAGARGFLTRPEATEFAVAAMRRILRGEIYVSHRLSSCLVKRLLDAHDEGRARAAREATALSQDEARVLRLVARGLTTGEIATELQLSAKSVSAQQADLRRKLDLPDEKEFELYAARWVARVGDA